MNNKFNTDEFFERFPHTLEAEMQVRTIFEEGYGEIDHLLRYSNGPVPEVVKSNLCP